MTANDDTHPQDWAHCEQLLDELLELPEAERKARLAELQVQQPEVAQVLQRWLAGIEHSAHDGWMASTEAEREGAVVGNWRVLQLLGQGGMGEVWLGERADGLFSKQVAIKFIRDDRPALHRGIEAERKALAGLHHPGIVRLFDAGISADGRPYLVTDYIDGARLDIWLQRQNPDLKTRLDLFGQIARALAHAHGQLVLHCDIKPANVLVDAAGNAHLMDFGIARALNQERGEASDSEQAALTPEFAALELLDGQSLSVRSDVYALGGLLYFLLCNQPPQRVRGLALPQAAQEMRQSAPQPLRAQMPEALKRGASRAWLADLEAIAMKALARKPEDRYASVEALLHDLEAARQHRPLTARPLGAMERLGRNLRRNRTSVAVLSLVIGLLVAGLAGTLWQARKAAQQRDLAEAEARRASVVRDFMVSVFDAANPELNMGHTPSARDLLEIGVRRVEQDLDGEPMLQAELFTTLGDSHVGLGHYAQAVELLQRALQAVPAGSAGDALAARRILLRYARAVLLHADGYDEARQRLEAALAAPVSEALPAQLLDIELRAHYASILHKLGQLEQAGALLDEAMQRARALGQAGQSALVTVLNYHMALDESRGQRERAIAHLREMVDLLDAQPLAAVADAQNARLNLAILLGSRGQGDEAERLMRRVRDGNLSLYGAYHPATLSANIGLGRALLRHGKYAQARELLRESLEQAMSRHGPDKEITALAQTSLAALEYSQGYNDTALELLQQVHAYVLARDGERGPRTLLMQQNIARVHLDEGRLDQVEALLQDTLDALGEIGSEAQAEVVALLGDVARQRGDFRRARELHQQALDLYAANGDTESFEVQDHRLALVVDERDMGHLEAARSLARQGIEGLQQLDPQANAAMLKYAHALVAQFDVQEQRCDAEGRQALEAMLESLHELFEGGTPTPAYVWKFERMELYLGLCRSQIDPQDERARQRTREAAQRLLDSSLTDPHTRQLARTLLQTRL